MFQRNRLGIRLAMQSLAIIRDHFRLLIYPILSRGSYLLVFSAVTFWLWSLNNQNIMINQLPRNQLVKFYALFLFSLFVCNLLASFMNAAFAVSVVEYHAGLKPTLAEGLRAAKKRWLTLLEWTFIKVILGSTLMLSGKTLYQFEWVQKLTQGLPWRLSTYFIIPKIMYHPGHARLALEESSQMMLSYAGHKAQINYSLIFPIFLLRIACLLVASLALHAHALHIAAIIGLLSFSLFAIVSIINAIINNVVHSALHHLIKTNEVPKGFVRKDLENAIKRSKKNAQN